MRRESHHLATVLSLEVRDAVTEIAGPAPPMLGVHRVHGPGHHVAHRHLPRAPGPNRPRILRPRVDDRLVDRQYDPRRLGRLVQTVQHHPGLDNRDAGGGANLAAKGPLREFGVDPVSQKPVVAKDGKFGVYVTDGETNATVPRGEDPMEIDFDRAVELIADKIVILRRTENLFVDEAVQDQEVLVVQHFRHTFKHDDFKAVQGLTFDVYENEIFGLLGPNGAGKTTTVRILATLLSPDSGQAFVSGIDVLKHPDEVRKIIGLSGQYAAVDETLTGWDNLIMFGRLYHLSAKAAKDRAVELLEQFVLSDAAKRPIRTYSGGMRRRLDLAASLIIRPKVLFLDEPTTGLDPRGRQDMWGVIDELVKGGVTLLLTTQYLEEADHLADEIAVIDHGKVIARGTSDSLKRQVGGERLEIVVENEYVAAVTEIVAKVSGGAVNVDESMRQISAPVTTGSKALIEAAKMLDEKGIHPLDIGLKRPSLDDVFLSLTGHVAEEKVAEEELTTKGRRRGK